MIKSLIVEESCIGCGMCEKICPSNFKVKGMSKVISQDFSKEKEILEAEQHCPVSAIHTEVTNKETKKGDIEITANKNCNVLNKYNTVEYSKNIINWVQKFILLSACITPFVYFFPEKWGLLWDLSWYSLVILMLIRPCAEIFSQLTFIKKLIPLRKSLGIFSATIVVLAGLLNYASQGLNFFELYFSIEHWNFKDFSFFAHVSELAGLILLISSNIWSEKILGKYWKSIQRLSYVYFFAGGVYIFYLGKDIALYSMILVSFFWFLANRKIVICKS